MKHPTPIQISIPQPCSEDWNKMSPQQQGRFCDSCRKCVVDFTGFTDAQLYQFLAEHHGQKVCGRFRNTQLNRHIDIPPQPHSQLYKWIMAAGLALVFVAAPEGKVFAQAPLAYEQYEGKDSTENTGFISGYTRTVEGRNLSGINIYLTLATKPMYSTYSDENGRYSFSNIQPGRYDIVAEFTGYKKAIISGLSIGDTFYIEQNIQLEKSFNSKDNSPIITEYKHPLVDIYNAGATTMTTGGVSIEEMPVRSKTAVDSVLKNHQNNTPANRSNKKGEK